MADSAPLGVNMLTFDCSRETSIVRDIVEGGELPPLSSRNLEQYRNQGLVRPVPFPFLFCAKTGLFPKHTTPCHASQPCDRLSPFLGYQEKTPSLSSPLKALGVLTGLVSPCNRISLHRGIVYVPASPTTLWGSLNTKTVLFIASFQGPSTSVNTHPA